MGFTSAMRQFLRACCGKKKKNRKASGDTTILPLSPPPKTVVSVPEPQSQRRRSKVVRDAAPKRASISNEESAIGFVSSKKFSKSRKSRRPPFSSMTTTSQTSTETKSKKSSQVSSSSKNNNKPKDDDSTQPEEITKTARDRRMGKSQRVRKQQPPQPKPAVPPRKWAVENAAFRVQLTQFVTETARIGVNGLVEQFAQLKMATSMPPAKTHFDANNERNRYKDVVCIDRSRVILRWPTDATNDYIHANWVEFMGVRKFICTQAPTELTIDDFWRLVWQEKCKSIVMLCELVEQNKQKCVAYWPTMPQQSIATLSELCVKNVQVRSIDASLTISLLEVSCPSEAGAEPLDVCHFKWNNWPDRGVPDNCLAPFRLLDQLTGGPVIIHCSAGIGRTGTIVSLYMALQVLHADKPLSLGSVVRELRAQRHGSVQTVTQFLFMHRALVQLAENMQLVGAEDVARFGKDYDKFIREHGG